MRTPSPAPTLALAALLALGLLLTATGCLSEPFTGSEVVMELGTASQNAGDIANRPTEHYELFAEINDGLVSIGKFRIDSNLNAVTFPGGEKIGSANKLGAGLPEGGISMTSDANLATATGVLLTIETNGETDLAPSDRIIGYGVLVPGPRSTLNADLEGDVPTLLGASPLISSRVAIVITEDDVYF